MADLANWITAVATAITVPIAMTATIFARAASVSLGGIPKARLSNQIVTISLDGDTSGHWEIVSARICRPARMEFCRVEIDDSSTDGNWRSVRGVSLGRRVKNPTGPYMLSRDLPSGSTLVVELTCRHILMPLLLRKRRKIILTSD